MIKRRWNFPAINSISRSQAITFFVCLAISFAAWLSIKLSKESTRIIPIELQVSNIPENIIFTHFSDSVFALSLQTTGIRFLSQFSTRGNRLETDFNSLQKIRGEELYFYTASQAELRFSLLNELPRSNVNAHPDTIFFTATEAFRKRVPVIPQLNLDFRPGFKIYKFPTIVPDSIYVTGPVYLQESVNFIYTEPLKATAVDKTIAMDVNLVNPLPSSLIRMSHTQATINVPIEEYTEATVQLPLTITCPELEQQFPSSRILLFPETVEVYYLVAFRDIRTITPEMFEIQVSCPDTLAQAQARLPIEVTEHPGLVEIIRTRPSEVEYVWIKN